MINYSDALDIKKKIDEIIENLKLKHIDKSRVFCIRSYGSKARNVIARCHSLSKILQKALKQEPSYVIEVISEKFDKLGEEEKIKVLIHELMHIPKSFGGGFRHHNIVNNKKVNRLYKKFVFSKFNIVSRR